MSGWKGKKVILCYWPFLGKSAECKISVPEGVIHREEQFIEIGVLVWINESRHPETMKKL